MQVHFISGLPRSGSTLLCNILAQNPALHAAGTSGLLDMLLEVRNDWDQQGEFRAMPHEESERHKICFLRGAFNGYFAPYKNQICFDKNRKWPGYLEMIEGIFTPPPCKIIVTIRDLRDVLASLELLWRKTSITRQIPMERTDPHGFLSVAGRLQWWMDKTGMVGQPLNCIFDAARRGYLDRMHFVDYDRLTAFPQVALAEIHEFLSLEEYDYDYDFDNVRNVIAEDDRAYDFPGLHQIRPQVLPQDRKWPEVLGEFAQSYEKINDVLYSLVPDRPGELTEPDAGSPSPLANGNPVQAVSSRHDQLQESQDVRVSGVARPAIPKRSPARSKTK